MLPLSTTAAPQAGSRPHPSPRPNPRRMGCVWASLLVLSSFLQLLGVSAQSSLQEPMVLRSANAVWGVTLTVKEARYDDGGVAFNTRLFCQLHHPHARQAADSSSLAFSSCFHARVPL